MRPEAAAVPVVGSSRLAIGRVVHRRLRPVRHRLAYRVVSLLVDLDELPALDARLRFFSLDRWNVFGLRQRDHGAGAAGGLREHVDRELQAAGLEPGGRILLLTMPRLFGHVFNPLSVYFCHRADGTLQALLYEVDNTFGDRHGYLIEVDADLARAPGGVIVQRCAKSMHVSPFLGLELDYRFRIRPPSAATPGLSIGIDVLDADGPVLEARLALRTVPLDDAALLRTLVSHPLSTLKVVAAIHWEALVLWLKGAPFHARPPAPARSTSVITRAGSR